MLVNYLGIYRIIYFYKMYKYISHKINVTVINLYDVYSHKYIYITPHITIKDLNQNTESYKGQIKLNLIKFQNQIKFICYYQLLIS